MRQRTRTMPFTEEQMKQVFETNLIDFAKEYLGLDFKAAVETILGCRAYEHTQHVVTLVEKVPKEPLVLPTKDKNFNCVIAYLTETRGN